MKFLVIFCLLIGNIYGYFPHYMIGRNVETISMENSFHPHQDSNVVKSCTRDALAERKKSVCQPRPRLIPISTINHETVIPSMVEVKRCDGSCSRAGFSCIGVTSRIIEIPVNVIGNGLIRATQTCGVVRVQEHTSCSCACPIRPGDCPQRQEFVESQCRCQCANRDDEKRKCEGMSRIWYDFDCTCRCPLEQTCSSGAMFNHDMCKCMKFMEM